VAFDGTAHPPLVSLLEQAGGGQQRDLPVHGGLGDVGHAGAKLGGRDGPPVEHGVHDAQPHRVQDQGQRVHETHCLTSDIILKLDEIWCYR
jgi:hypothetical protein